MRDPDQTEMTPEEQQQAQAAAEQAEAQKAMFMAELEGKQAETALKLARIQREHGMTIKDRVDATGVALTSAQSVITMPTIAKVADGILQEVGWRDFKASHVTQGLPPMPEQMPPEQPMQEEPMPEAPAPQPEQPMEQPPMEQPPQ